MTNAPAKVLVVGAGAMGVVTGHVLQQGGTQVTYLVRPNRVAELSRPQRLYSYDDHALLEYSGYEIIDSPAAIRGTLTTSSSSRSTARPCAAPKGRRSSPRSARLPAAPRPRS